MKLKFLIRDCHFKYTLNVSEISISPVWNFALTRSWLSHSEKKTLDFASAHHPRPQLLPDGLPYEYFNGGQRLATVFRAALTQPGSSRPEVNARITHSDGHQLSTGASEKSPRVLAGHSVDAVTVPEFLTSTHRRRPRGICPSLVVHPRQGPVHGAHFRDLQLCTVWTYTQRHDRSEGIVSAKERGRYDLQHLAALAVSDEHAVDTHISPDAVGIDPLCLHT